MAEIKYLKHLLKTYKMSHSLKELIEKFFKIKNENELKKFANDLGIKIDNISSFEELRERVAFELVELYFKNRYINSEKN